MTNKQFIRETLQDRGIFAVCQDHGKGWYECWTYNNLTTLIILRRLLTEGDPELDLEGPALISGPMGMELMFIARRKQKPT